MVRLINITDITTFSVCPIKVYLKLVENKRGKVNEAIVFGRIKHKIIEEFGKKEKEIFSSIKENALFNEIYNLFLTNFNEIVKKIISKNKKIIEKYGLSKKLEEEVESIKKEDILIKTRLARKFVNLGFFGKELWNVLNPKFLSEFKLESYLLGIKGRIDRVKIDTRLNEIIPYEIKSRNYSNVIWFNEKLQLAGYALLLENHFKRKINFGILKFKDRSIKINISKALKNKVIEIKEVILDMVKNNSIPKIKVNKRLCSKCNLAEFCKFYKAIPKV